MTRKLGPFPLWLVAVAAVGGLWYTRQRAAGRIAPARRPLLLEAFDAPAERAELLRGIVIGLVSAVVTYYVLTRTKALR